MGFSRQHRIAAQREFREVLNKGERRMTDFFDLVFLVNTTGVARVGVVTKKKLGNAVVRNRIRRRIREVFRLFLPCYPKGFDMVVFPKSVVATCKFQALCSGYEAAMISLGALCPDKPDPAQP